MPLSVLPRRKYTYNLLLDSSNLFIELVLFLVVGALVRLGELGLGRAARALNTVFGSSLRLGCRSHDVVGLRMSPCKEMEQSELQ